MSDQSPTDKPLYRTHDHRADVFRLLDLAERQVERLDAMGWHFAIKLAAAATVVSAVTFNLFRPVLHNDPWEWFLTVGFLLLFGPVAWRLNRDRLARTRAEQRTLSRAVLATHELLPLVASILSPMEEQEIRLRLSRLPFDVDAEAEPGVASSKPVGPDTAPADVRPGTPSIAH